MDLLNNIDLSDFNVILPDKTYKLHKIFLSRCGYFKALFRTGSKESISNTVIFDQFTSAAFDIFLHVLYGITNEIPNDTNIIKSLTDLSLYLDYNQLTNLCVPHILKNKELFLFALIKYPEIINNSNGFYPSTYNFSDYILEHLTDIDDIGTLKMVCILFTFHRLDDIIITADKWYQKYKDERIWEVISEYYYYISQDIISRIASYNSEFLSKFVVYNNIKRGCITPSLLASKDKFSIINNGSDITIRGITSKGDNKIHVIGNRKFEWDTHFGLVIITFINIPDNSKIRLLVMNKKDGSYIIYRTTTGKVTFSIDAHNDGYDVVVYDE